MKTFLFIIILCVACSTECSATGWSGNWFVPRAWGYGGSQIGYGGSYFGANIYNGYTDLPLPWNVAFVNTLCGPISYGVYGPCSSPETIRGCFLARDSKYHLTQCSTGVLAGISFAPFPPWSDEVTGAIDMWPEGVYYTDNYLPAYFAIYFPKGVNGYGGSMPLTDNDAFVLSHANPYDGPTTGDATAGYDPGCVPYLQCSPAPWHGDAYGAPGSGESTIGKVGCAMTCAAMQLATMGVHDSSGNLVTPRTLNNALRARRGGYQHLRINWTAVCSIARGWGYNVRFRRRVRLDEAIYRGKTVEATVKNGRHWVEVTGYIAGEPGNYSIQDPMGRTIDDSDYPDGCNYMNTRCYYLGKGTWNPATGRFTNPQNGISAVTGSNVAMTLSASGPTAAGGTGILAQSEEEDIEDDETGVVAEVLYAADYAPEGELPARTLLTISGQPYTAYSIDVVSSSDGDDYITTLTGMIGVSGTKIVSLTPDLTAGSAWDGWVVTCVVPGGFWIQNPDGRSMPMYVQWTGSVPAVGSGVVLTGAQAYGNMITVTGVSQDTYSIGITAWCAAPPEHVGETMHLYCKTYGQVTGLASGGFQMNNCLNVIYSGTVGVGSFVAMNGVYDSGAFHATVCQVIDTSSAPADQPDDTGQSMGSLAAHLTAGDTVAALFNAPSGSWSQQEFNQVGSIGWASTQADGTVVTLTAEQVIGGSDDGLQFSFKEELDPLPTAAAMVLCLDQPVQYSLQLDHAMDITGTLTTLSTGQRAIIHPTSVYVYTDSSGQFMMPYILKPMAGEWQWKTRIAP